MRSNNSRLVGRPATRRRLRFGSGSGRQNKIVASIHYALRLGFFNAKNRRIIAVRALAIKELTTIPVNTLDFAGCCKAAGGEG
jgi:hypothetical protein